MEYISLGLSACGMTCKKGVQVINNKCVSVPGALNSIRGMPKFCLLSGSKRVKHLLGASFWDFFVGPVSVKWGNLMCLLFWIPLCGLYRPSFRSHRPYYEFGLQLEYSHNPLRLDLTLCRGQRPQKSHKMVSRRKILSRSRDDLNLDQTFTQQEEEEDIWFQKDKLYKVSCSYFKL